MRLPRPIPIDLLDFFRTGKFDCLRIGQTKELILHNFPDPDGYGPWALQKTKRGQIWTYGNIELHFWGEELIRIFSDYIHVLDGGPSLVLDCWILGKGSRPTLLESMTALNRERIDLAKTTRAYPDWSHVELLLSSGVELSFSWPGELESDFPLPTAGDQNEMLLGAFAWMDRSPVSGPTK